MFSPILIGIAILVVFLLSAIKILNQFERGVIFRLGICIGTKGPGLFILIPVLDRMVKVSLRTVTMDVPPQDVITKDNVSIKVNAVVYFRVIDPVKAINEVEDYYYATSQLAQTTLRSIMGEVDLDTLLTERENLNLRLQKILDESTDAWGIKIATVELKHIDLPKDMQRAMARQAEAERERRAKIIAAEGEFQAAEKLGNAAAIMAKNPVSIQLRYLQTLIDISSENNTITVFPIPMDIMSGLQKISAAVSAKDK